MGVEVRKGEWAIFGLSGSLKSILKHFEGLGKRVSPAKAAEPIEIPFGGGGLTHVGLKNHVLDGAPYRTNPFATRGFDKLVMQPFIKIFWPLVFYVDRW